MRKTVLTVLLSFMSIVIFCQEFAPIGAEWFYNEQFAFSGDIDYIKFTSEKDTLILGQNCKKIIKRHKVGCYNRPSIEYLYSSNDTVYFLDEAFDKFQILYVINSKPTDSWNIQIFDEEHEIDTITITVDSISTTSINNQSLRRLYVTYNKIDEYMPESYPSTIVEKIGDIQYMFNWYPWSNVACDANYTSGLRCYQDSELGLYSTGIVDSCNYVYKWTNIKGNELYLKIDLFPNPARDFVEVSIAGVAEFAFELYDINGRLLLSTKSTYSPIDISRIGKGLFFVFIRSEGQIIGCQKLIKE
ncbi:MAG: T9SS type A sorting domain-containing protein [Bacteroidetes bacterium]|nr:T9SS type A sorting domain-containing protein [Bacteroidota bacterium]